MASLICGSVLSSPAWSRLAAVTAALTGRVPAEAGELEAPSRADRLAQFRIGMAGEVLEGSAGTPLLALEEQRHERRGEQQRGSNPQPPLAHQGASALAGCAVADLVMV